VDIFEGEGKWLWLLSKDLLTKKEQCIFCFSKQDKEVADRFLTFTSEENRDKYIQKEKDNKFISAFVDKKPVFVSADNVDIFEGDMVYKVILESKTIVPYHAKKGEFATEGGIRFSSHQSASEYLKKLNPIFVSADGKEYFERNDTGYNLFSVNPKNNFLERRFLVAQAIENKEWLHFHTKEARQEYIDNNKPKYGLADIEKAYGNTKSPTDSPLFQSFKSELKKLGK